MRLTGEYSSFKIIFFSVTVKCVLYVGFVKLYGKRFTIAFAAFFPTVMGSLARATYAKRSRGCQIPPWGAPEHDPAPPGNKQRIREASRPKKVGLVAFRASGALKRPKSH
jgi:hypothetical protein